MKPFIYAHQLISNNAGIWIGCNDEAAVRGSHTPGETGDEVIALYHGKDVAELQAQLAESIVLLERAREVIRMFQGR